MYDMDSIEIEAIDKMEEIATFLFDLTIFHLKLYISLFELLQGGSLLVSLNSQCIYVNIKIIGE